MIEHNKFFFNKLRNVVFIGETKILRELRIINHKIGLKTFFITSSHQSKNIKKKNELNLKIFDKIDKTFLKYLKKNKLIIDNTLFISIGSRIIFKKEIIKNVFKDNLINVHPSMLPIGAGAGHFSWKILNNDRIEMQLIHLVNEKIDAGPIIKYEKGIFPEYCKKPIDYENFFLKNFLKFYSNFIIDLKNQKKFLLKFQPDYLGFYLPKLNTLKNGFIDWNKNSSEIYRFICAFDDPYQGASTFLNSNYKEKIFLKDIFLQSGIHLNHSFMTGLIINKEKKWIEVCTPDNNILIIKKILNNKIENIIDKLKKGDRFFTPQKKLDDAKMFRAKYTPKGLK